MILTTTSTIEGHKITDYRGIVVGEAVVGAQAFVAISLEGAVG